MASSISSTLPGINDQRKGGCGLRDRCYLMERECMYASCSGVVKQKNERVRWESGVSRVMILDGEESVFILWIVMR
ncbi:hypothetical protein COLO4_07243 [Corchorus olitorius]|uniref:Uncharacterized protein n=1 Tax=Corchorus olitorius TaxID=93759 RepID=A0A1R3KKN5_9ROSI|nr:hypothetical protein COLO4_07243 [Corchorus olitorius]